MFAPSVLSLLPTFQTHKLSDSGHPAPGSLPPAANGIFPAGAQALHPLVSAAPLAPRLSFLVGSTTEGPSEVEERRFSPIGRTPQ